MGDASMSVEQQPKPNVLEQSPSREERFSVRLAKIREYAQEVAWMPIDQKFQALDSRKGVLKFPAALSRSLLIRQREKVQKKLEEPDKIKRKRDDYDYRHRQPKPLPQNKEESLLAVGNAIRAVRDNYELLAEDIIQDATIPTEIRDRFIQEKITPELDKLLRDGKFTPDQINDFYPALNACIEQWDMHNYYKTISKELERFTSGNYEFRNNCDTLIKAEDKTVVKFLIAKIAAEDISAIWKSVNLQLKRKDLNRRFRSIYNDIFDQGLEPRSEFESKRPTFKFLLRLQRDKWIPDIRIWQATKDSKRASEIFGEVIKEQDQENYATALDISLSDPRETGSVDNTYLLSYYPTPEAIRNLILLTANSNRNTSAYASRTLKDIARRADWREILDKAEEVYPALKTVRPLLSDTEFFDPSNGYRHKIAEESQDLILSIVENNTSDSKLRARSTEALTCHSVLGLLTKRGLIQPSEVTMLNKITGQPNGEFRIPHLKENLFELMYKGHDKGETKQRLEFIRRSETLARIKLENESNNQAEVYLTDESVIQKLQNPSLKQEDVDIFLEAFKTVPALTSKRNESIYYLNYSLCSEFVKQFKGKETIQLFNELSASYNSFPEQLVDIIKLVGESRISRERAVELPTKASDIITNPLFSVAVHFPNKFLATDQDTEFFSATLTSYQSNGENINLIATALENNSITSYFALTFPEHAPALMQDKMKETKIFIWKNGETMLHDESDLKFLNRLVGEFGQKADSLIRGYQECLKAEVVTTEEKELVLEFAKQFRVVAPTTLAGYKEAKQGGFEKGYIAQLKSLAEKMTGSGTITDEERKRPYYKDLLKHVYSNNSGQWSSFESNESCADRSPDLADFKINPRYEIDLLSQSEIRIKAGETPNPSVQDEVQRPIVEIAKRLDALGHDKEKINLALKEDIDNILKEIVEKGGIQGIDLASLTPTEEKMFLILTDSIYGTGSIDPKRVKDLVTTYEFATFEDISDYMAGTRDRVSRANNQDYALLCEVGAFYSDRIKEVNRRLVEEAYKNPQIVALMPEYFRKLSQESTASHKQDRINRLQINRLGASESFVKQLTGVLEKRRKRKYEPEEVKEIIRRYEDMTGGLHEKSSNSQNPQTRAFYGQLRSQRERSFEALDVISGEKADPQKVHLGEINLQQAHKTETGIKEGKYDEEQFASYTAQRFIDLFEEERIKIEGELDKFESITGKQREVLCGYISKSKESANARMVGGVCVAGDNPSKNKNTNMWDMPNYFQLVLQEPDTLQCQGAVLLHNFTQDGKRILAASLNPSSTYLYSVDETALFNGIMGTLEQFAKDNNIDMITFSQNKTIRTNRTGGQFEKTMDAKIASVNKKFAFDSPQTFSYSPKYQLQDMDVVWEKS